MIKLRKLVCAIGMVSMLFLALALGDATTGLAAPPGAPQCWYAANGRVWTDPVTGKVYECVCTLVQSGAKICVWVELTTPGGHNWIYQDSSEADSLDASAASPSYNGVYAEGDFYSFFQNATAFYHSPGNLTLDLQVYYWNGSSWVLTNDTGWIYNGSTDYTIFNESYVGLPRGAGYYGVQSYGYGWNGSWKGGTIWSGYKWFSGPASPSSKASYTMTSPPTGTPQTTVKLPPPPTIG